MVIQGQLIQADSLSISIEVANVNGPPIVEQVHPSTHNTITATLETRSDISIRRSPKPKEIYLFNNKHKVVFKDSYVSEITRDEGGSATVDLSVYDYSVVTGWCDRFE